MRQMGVVCILKITIKRVQKEKKEVKAEILIFFNFKSFTLAQLAKTQTQFGLNESTGCPFLAGISNLSATEFVVTYDFDSSK